MKKAKRNKIKRLRKQQQQALGEAYEWNELYRWLMEVLPPKALARLEQKTALMSLPQLRHYADSVEGQMLGKKPPAHATHIPAIVVPSSDP